MSDAIYGIKASDVSSIKEILEFLEAYGVHLEVLFERAESLKDSLESFDQVKEELERVKDEVKTLRAEVEMKKEMKRFKEEHDQFLKKIRKTLSEFSEEILEIRDKQLKYLNDYIIEASKRLKILEKGCFVSVVKMAVIPVMFFLVLVGVTLMFFDVDLKAVDGVRYLIFRLP